MGGWEDHESYGTWQIPNAKEKFHLTLPSPQRRGRAETESLNATYGQ